MAVVVATTSMAGVAPRMVDGYPAEDAFARMQSVLATRLGTVHANLFALPRRQGDAITWVADTDGEIGNVGALPATGQAAAMAAVERLLSDVRALADRLGTENRELARLARVLRAAARTPSPALVRTVGTQPVIILWTHEATAAALIEPAAARATIPVHATASGLGVLHAAWILPLLLGSFFAIAAIGSGTMQVSEDPRVAPLRAQLDQLRAINPAQCAPAQAPKPN